MPLGITRLPYLYIKLPHATEEDIRLSLMGYFWLQHTLPLVTVTMTEHDYGCMCIIKNDVLFCNLIMHMQVLKHCTGSNISYITAHVCLLTFLTLGN